MKNEKGFTLIELMVVVMIVGIFASTARPFFKQYQADTNRADVQAELVRIAQQMHFFYSVNSTYTGATPIGISNSINYPVKKPIYVITLTRTDNATTGQKGVAFLLTATPISTSTMKNDGVICINNRNQKHYAAGSTKCSLSDTSKWAGE